MAIADLLKDARLKPQSSKKQDADLIRLTPDFIRRRVRRLVELNPGDADPKKPGDITAAATIAIGNLIARDLPKVHAAAEEIGRRVSTDAAHLSLDPAVIRKRGTKRAPLARAAALANRRVLVRSIVYQACAFDITLADPGSIKRLHVLCDRRLRIAERMMYDVGQVPGRSWNRAQINAHRGGPWLDGWERIFEYPRLPRSVFLSACRPDAFSVCSPPMNAWSHPASDIFLHTAINANPSTRKSWLRTGPRLNELHYQKTGGKDAVPAIEGMFQPSTDYQSRNLMYCDHTIHALHLEALVFSRAKRGEGSAWLENEMAVQPPAWLRIYVPLGEPGRYIAGPNDTSKLFEHITVRQSDLQVGDHLIVYNHPAYAKALPDGVWKLENAVVAQTSPTLLMQGHGSALRDLDGMKTEMLGLFANGLKLRRQDVEGFGRVVSFGPNTVTVDTASRLHVLMKIDIVSADAAETELATGRTITSITGRVIGYDGQRVSSTKSHRVRMARKKIFDKQYTAIEGDGGYRLMRRVEPQASDFDVASQKADWFLSWNADEAEEAIRKDPARAAFVKDHQLIEYTREKDGAKTVTVGWFPLWRPSLVNGIPKRRNCQKGMFLII